MEGYDFDDKYVMKFEKSKLFYGLKKLFRITEILLLLFFIAWALNRLPFAVRISREYFRQLVKVVVSHLFVFVLSNLIVLILFFNSRNLFQHQNISENLIEEISSPQPEEIVYQDKRTILEVKKVKVHRRSQSENFSLKEDRKSGKQLRRSETERRRRVEAEEEMVDEMSNEEFQRAIEAFIAKQIKFHQQEKMAIVLHACN